MDAVQAIILKIDHSVEEIRSRSLDSIIKKLDHGILHEKDLLENNQLMINLLKWFSHETVPSRKDVLNLILRLCKKSLKGLEQFVDLDGVNFIVQMKRELVGSDRHLVKIMDEIIDCLKKNNVNCLDVPLKLNSPLSNSSSEKMNEISDNSYNNKDAKVQPVDNSCLEYSGFKVISLPWINVQSIDLQILHSTNISLKSDDVQVVSKAIDFLMDVVFKDFLPEIFLQYSQLLKNLIAITNWNHMHIHSLPQKASRCLQLFIKLLCVRINYKKDAAFFNLKQDIGAAVDNTSNKNSDNIGDFLKNDLPINKLRSRGDGQDGDARDYLKGNHSDNTEFIKGDHSNEISIPQFCIYFINNTQHLQQSNILGVLTVMLELLYTICDLFSVSFTTNIWNDNSLIGRALCGQLKILFKTLSNSIFYHHSQLKRSENNLNVHWIVFCGLLKVSLKILRAISTVEMFANLGLPECFTSCLLIGSLNFPIYQHKSSLHENLRCYLLATDNSEMKRIYLEAITLQSSLKSASEFEKLEGDDFNKSLLKHAEIAVNGLTYFCNFEFEDVFVNYFSKELGRFDEFEIEQGIRILMILFKHRNVDVRKQIYSKCLSFVQNFASDYDDGNSLQQSKSRIFLNVEILRCIVENGFSDENDEIKNFAKAMITVLIGHFNKITDPIRKTFYEAILSFLPVLLAYCDASTNLGKMIFNLFDNNGYWSICDLIKANILFLFSTDKTVRAQTTPRIAWLLAKDEDSLYKLPNLSRLKTVDLADALIRVKTPSLFSTSVGHEFQNFGFLLSIFCNENGALATRKKAGLQLVDALNSGVSCQQFETINGSRAIFNLLQSMISIKNCVADQLSDVNFILLPVSLEIFWKSIKYFFYCNSIFNWSTEAVYYTLLRIALLYHSDDYAIGLVSSSLALLLFYNYFEVSSCKDDGSIWVASSAIYQRYYLPFSEINLRIITGEILPAEINNKYLDSFLRYVWNDIKASNLERFALSPNEVELLNIAERFSNFNKCLGELAKANSHKPLIQSLKLFQLEILLMSEDPNIDFDVNLFQSTFERFVIAPPKTNADKSLFKSILQFLIFILNWCPLLNEKLLEIIYKMILLRNGAIQCLMNISDDQYSTDSSQEKLFSPFTKELLKLVSTILSKASYMKRHLFETEMTNSLPIFIEFLHQHLNVADSSQFYNLASLESVLHSLVHVTARLGFGNNTVNEAPMDICRRLTSLLMDIIAAFHLSQENSHLSFMGRGVTLSATICLSHIAREMFYISSKSDWAKYWLFKYELQDEAGSQMGLGWLISLWTHSDVEVRVASMSIMSTLTSSRNCLKIVMSHTQQLAGSLWGVALTFLVDHSEASIVREQAALILFNLIANLSHNENSSILLNGEVWYGPIISDPGLQIPRVGLPALLILLQRINFTQEMTVILSNLYTYSHLIFKSFSTKNLDSQTIKIKDDFSLLDTTMSILFERTDQNFGDTLPDDFKLMSLSTCFLVKTICQILRNLVLLAPGEMMIAMKNVKLFQHLERTFLVSKAMIQNESSLSEVKVFEISNLLKSVLDLLSLCCQVDKSLSLHIINNQLLSHLIEILDCKLLGENFKIPIEEMWASVYNILLVILSTADSADCCYYYKCVFKLFPIIIDSFRTVLNQQYGTANKSALMWLVKFLSTFSDPEFCQSYDISFKPISFTNIFDSTDTRFENKESGFVLSNVLFIMLKKVEHNPSDSEKLEMTLLIINTFSTLLAVSESAKSAAIENDLLTLVLLKLTSIFEHYNLFAVDCKIPKNVKNRITDMFATNIICYFNLLKNFMHTNIAVKNLASKSDLCHILLSFWSFVNAESARLLPPYLSLICTYISNCSSAGKTLCTPTLNLKKTNTTILGEILKFCKQEFMWVGKQSNTENIELAFNILGTLCFVPEACSQIIKSKICQYYGAFSMSKTKSSFQFIPSWWLKLFIKMTFSREGRETVIGIPGILDDFALMLSSKECNDKNDVMTIIRNLCFMKTKKNRILKSSDLFIIVINFALVNTDDKIQLLAASALWTLLANNRQAKIILKCEGFIHRLEDVMNCFSSQESHGEILNVFESILKILQGQINNKLLEMD